MKIIEAKSIREKILDLINSKKTHLYINSNEYNYKECINLIGITIGTYKIESHFHITSIQEPKNIWIRKGYNNKIIICYSNKKI